MLLKKIHCRKQKPKNKKIKALNILLCFVVEALTQEGTVKEGLKMKDA